MAPKALGRTSRQPWMQLGDSHAADVAATPWPGSCCCIRLSSGLAALLQADGQLVSTAGACWALPSLRIPMGMDSLGSAHLAALKPQGPMDSVCTAPGSIIQPPPAYI